MQSSGTVSEEVPERVEVRVVKHVLPLDAQQLAGAWVLHHIGAEWRESKSGVRRRRRRGERRRRRRAGLWPRDRRRIRVQYAHLHEVLAHYQRVIGLLRVLHHSGVIDHIKHYFRRYSTIQYNIAEYLM